MRSWISIVFALVMLTSTIRADVPTHIKDTIEGILVGAFGEDGKAVDECIDEGTVIFNDVKKAVEFFEKGDVTDIVQGLYWIGKALEEMPTELKDCESITALIADFEKIAEEFKNPEELVIHIGTEILWHGKDVYGDITDCPKQFRAGEYEKAGEDIGDLIKILFIDDAPKDGIVEDVTEFTEAFYTKCFDITLDLETCEGNVEAAWEEVKHAIDELENMSIESIEEGIKDLIIAVPHLFTAFEGCEDQLPLIEAGLAKLDVFVEHPLEIPEAVTLATAKHPIQTAEDAYEVYHAFHDKPYDFKKGGTASGDYVELVMEQM